VATRIVVLRSKVGAIDSYSFAPAWADRFKMVVRSVYGAVGNNGAVEIEFVEHVGGYVHNPGFEAVTPPHAADKKQPERAMISNAPKGFGWAVGAGQVTYGNFASLAARVSVEGRQALMLSGSTKGDDEETVTTLGSVSQYLHLKRGETYRLRFALSASYDKDGHYESLKKVVVSWDQEALATLEVDSLGFGPLNLPWNYHDFEVTASGADVIELRFEGLVHGVLLDDVSVFFGGRPADTKTCEARTAGECVCGWGELPPWDSVPCTVADGASKCGSGSQTRLPECKIHMEGHSFDGDDCPGVDGCDDQLLSHDELAKTCNDYSGCDFVWSHEEWGPDECPLAGTDDFLRKTLCPNACPRTCKDSAVKTREVNCMRLVPGIGIGDGGHFDPVAAKKCGSPDSHGLQRPEATMACTNDEACVTRWQCSAYGACESGCGTSKKTRSCMCWRSDGVNGLDASVCEAKGLARPTESEDCKNFDHCQFMWHVSSSE